MLMSLVIGDWSEDGHGKSNKSIYDVNHTVEEVQEAYKASCKKTGVSFNHNDDYTETDRDWKEAKEYHIACDYGDSSLNETVYNILKEYIPNLDSMLDEGYDGSYYLEEFEELWWEFVKISLPDVTYVEQKSKIPNINGYWGNLNVQFGYGLFE